MIKHVRNTPLLSNIGSLLIIQLMNYVIPLIVLPVLVNKLGDKNYGIFALAQYVSALLMFLCDYGFVYTGPKQVSQNQKNGAFLNSLFSTVTFIKTGLFVVSIICVFIFCTSTGLTTLEKGAMYISIFGLAGNMLTPLWFLQGIQKLKSLSYLNVVVKLLQLFLLLFLIKGEDDLLLACWLFFGLNFILGLVSFVYVIQAFKLKFVQPTLLEIRQQLKLGLTMFGSVFLSSIYIQGTGIILRFATGSDQYVAYYSAGEKFARAVTYMFNPFIQAFFPFISIQFSMQKQMALVLFFKFLKLLIVLTSIVAIIMFLTGNWLVSVLFDASFEHSATVIYILSPLVVLGNVGNMFGFNLFIQLGWEKVTLYCMMLLALFSAISCYILSKWYAMDGAALSLILTELLGVLFFVLYYRINAHKIC